MPIWFLLPEVGDRYIWAAVQVTDGEMFTLQLTPQSEIVCLYLIMRNFVMYIGFSFPSSTFCLVVLSDWPFLFSRKVPGFPSVDIHAGFHGM